MSSAKPGAPKRQAAPKRPAGPTRAPAAKRGKSAKRRSGGGLSRALLPLAIVALVLGLVMYLGGHVPAAPPATDAGSVPATGGAAKAPAAPGSAPAGGASGSGTSKDGTPKASTAPVANAPKSSPDATPDAKVKTDHAPEAAPVLYLVSDSKSGQQLVATPAPASADLKALAVQLVQKGDSANPGSGIPKGTVLKDVTVKNGVAYVNLSGAITHLVGAAAAKQVEYSLVYTLTSQGLGVQKVQLEFDGKPAMLDEMDWSAPKGRADLR